MTIPREDSLDTEARLVQRRDLPARGIRRVKEVEGDISAHASQHRTGGSDPITASDIGALKAGHTHIHDLFIYPSQDAILDDWPHNTAGAADEVAFIWHVPATFTALNSMSIVMIPDATETIQADLDVSVAAAGEDYNADTRQSLNETFDVTIDDITEWDISDIDMLFDSFAAGDYVVIRFQSNTDTLRILGLRVNYEA